MKEIRCKKCNALLMKGEIEKGKIEIRCRNCKTDNIICNSNKKVLHSRL